MKGGWVVAALFLAAAGVGCGGNSAAPSTAPAVETFAGTLTPQGSNFYAFSVAVSGTASLTLASVTSGTSTQPTAIVVGLGLGVPSGEGCALTSSANVAPALTAQVTGPVSMDIYCAEVYDPGTLTSPVNFVVRIAHP